MKGIKCLPCSGCVIAKPGKGFERRTVLRTDGLAPSVIFWSDFTFRSTWLLSQHFFEEECFIFMPHSTWAEENSTFFSLPQQ